jgi:hypothetical protein
LQELIPGSAASDPADGTEARRANHFLDVRQTDFGLSSQRAKNIYLSFLAKS